MNKITDVGSLQDLEALFKASPIDLVRRFKARRVGDNYVLPIETTPWFTIINLDKNYELAHEGKPLRITGIRITGYVEKPWFAIIMGFLINEQTIVGTAITGTKPLNGCRAVPLTPPLDLYELPKNVKFPKPTAIINETSINETIEIKTPMECLQDLQINPNTTTNQLIIYTNLVSIMTRAHLDLTNMEITY